MKNAIVWVVLFVALAATGVVWFEHRTPAAGDADDKKPADADAAGGSRASHDDQGNAVIKLDDKGQKDAGIVATNPVAGKWSQEVKGYGRVLDPAPLVEILNDVAVAETAAVGTTRELERQKTLSAQTNASARALETAEAAAQHDQLAVQAARARLALAWGDAFASRDDLPALAQRLIARQAALVRVDLAGGEALAAKPSGARLVALSGATTEAKFLGMAATVDPESQGQGFVFSVETNDISLTPGQAVTAWLQTPDEPASGVIIPRDAVVRLEGAGWIYLTGADGGSFTRRQIPLDRPTDDGWFVTGSVKTEDHVVVVGAQTLLSEELKAALTPD